MSQADHQRLMELIDALCSQTLDAAGVAELETMLIDDAEARRVYRHAINTHSVLRQYAQATSTSGPKVTVKPLHVIIAAAVIVVVITVAAIVVHRIFPAKPGEGTGRSAHIAAPIQSDKAPGEKAEP